MGGRGRGGGGERGGEGGGGDIEGSGYNIYQYILLTEV